jgi:hypothetical protein
MTASSELQKLVFDTLTGDAGLTAIVGARVYDRALPNAAFPFISFGPTSFFLVQDDCLSGRIETIQVDVWSESKGGKRQCKDIVDLVVDALNGIEAELTTVTVADMRVVLVQVLDDPDGITSHGVVQVEALIDEVA